MLKIYIKKGDEEKENILLIISKEINEEVIPLRATYVIKNERGEFGTYFQRFYNLMIR